MPVFVALVVVADVATEGKISKTAKKGVDAVIDAGGKVVDKVVDVGRAIAKDPLPVIATVALSAVGVPAPVAAAAVTAAKGGSVSQIATAAVASVAGGMVGAKVGGYTAGTQTAAKVATATGTSVEAVAKVAASASGSSVAATTAAVIQGKDLGTALKEGAIAGVGGGVGEAAAQVAAAKLPIENRLAQAGVAGAAGGAAQAAVTGEDIAKGAIVSGISTAGATFLADKRIEAQNKQAAAEIQKIVNSSVTDPSVNIQVAGAMPVTAEQVQQLTRMSESKVAENILQRAANDPKFIRTAANEASLQVLRDAGYVNLANALAKVTVGMTTLLTPGNIGQETNEDAIMAQKMKEFLTPIASKDYALAPVQVTSTIPAGKLQPNESISRDGALLENGKPTGLYVDKAGTLYDEEGNPAVKNYAPANISPVLASNLPIVPKAPTATPKAPSSAVTVRSPGKAPAPAPAPETITAPAPMPEPVPEPAPAPRPVTKLEPAPQPPARTGLSRFITDVPRREPTPSTISARDRQIMEASGIDFAPKPTEPDTRVRTDIVEEPTLKPVPEEDAVASQKFPLTEQTAAGRSRPIDFMYQNIGAPMGTPFMGRELSPGTSALAQALSVGDPGALYLGKKGKERRPVWNVESLKLSDELGGTYG